MRTCVVCRRRREEVELQRAGLDAANQWYLGRGEGRGLWWCREGECASGVSLAQASRALKRDLRAEDVQGLREVAQRSKMVVVVEE